jgi:cell division protein FtsW
MVTGFLGLILLLQPDFGGAVFLGMLFFLMSLVGGTRLTYLGVSMFFGVGAMGLLIASSPYRFKRWFAFLDPFKDPQNVGYQLVQSFYAFGSGGVGGAGFGAGKQKLFYLPEAHNDFIMAVVGEELGFVGVSIVFVCIGILLYRAFKVALAQDDLRDRFTAYGMGLVLGLGFILNLAVVLGCVPPKGVAMPFLSYGGSNLLSCFLCVGILLNLSRSART